MFANQQVDQKNDLHVPKKGLMWGFRFVIGVPPVIIHFERWDFP